MKNQTHKFCIAPMMDWTDRHCRAFHRTLTRSARLYTEMVTADAVIHGDRERLLGFSEIEHPLALQLGGSAPVKLAKAAHIARAYGYDEINLNVGCPSDRVQNGRFGACLMREPALVGECLAALQSGAPDVLVTLKCRLGVDEQDPEEALFAMLESAAHARCSTVIVHARKAWLEGLSPAQNRNLPPLDYGLVRRAKARWPALKIILNGGLVDLASASAEGEGLDGVMLGRAAYQTPALLLDVDPLFFGRAAPAPDAVTAVKTHLAYIEARLDEGVRLHAMTRHMLGLFHAQPGARTWRRALSQEGVKPGAGGAVVRNALEAVSPAHSPARSDVRSEAFSEALSGARAARAR